MTDRQPTVWALAAHTAAKHSILRGYLGAWFPKLAWARRIIFVDGFAGPGEYTGGEPGSPIIALDAAISHKSDLSRCELRYLFIEQDGDRFRHLKSLLDDLDVPSHVRITAIHGEFSETVTQIIAELKGKQLAPAFVMIDPFGVKGLPLSVIGELAKFKRTELLVSLMYESMTRWLSHKDFEHHLNDLYGCVDWREAIPMDADGRKAFLQDLYARQLGLIGMEYVRSFEMIDDGGRTEYFLVYATHHIEGLKAMKAAMWTIDAAGAYRFSDRTDPDQPTLFQAEPDFNQLESLIWERFRGSVASVEEVEDFVVVETAFRETHYKRQILAKAEREERIKVVKSPRQKGFSYPAGTMIEFPA